MLDNLRDSASSAPFFQDDEPIAEPQAEAIPSSRRTIDQITGLTAQQRFVLAVMLFVVVGLLGSIVLLVTGKFIPPFF